MSDQYRNRSRGAYLEKFEQANWTYSPVQENLFGFLVTIVAVAMSVSSCVFPKVKEFAKDFRVGAVMSFIVPLTLTSVLCIVANIVAGVGGLIFGIFSLFASVLLLAFYVFDLGNSIG